MKKLSVVTVTYNACKTIERTLESVLNQTYPYIQHIVIDGASTDNTLSIIKKYNRENYIYISEKDNGIYDAMNKSIDLISADYVCFLNAGDTFFDNNTVSHLFDTVKDSLPDIIYGETSIVDINGKIIGNRRLKAPSKLNWKSFRHGMLVCHQAFIVKKNLLEPYNLRYKYSSDVDWCIRIMKKSQKIHNTYLILIKYLNEGTTTENRFKSLKERYKIMSFYYGNISTFFYHIWFIIRAIINKI